MISYIGIDLGQKGCIAVQSKLSINKPKLHVVPFWQHWNGTKLRPPTEQEIYETLRELLSRSGDTYVCIEHPVFIPANGKKAVASLHENFGFIKGCLMALGATSFVYPKPLTWKKLTGAPGSDKSKMVRFAQRLFKHPGINELTADAVLISEYCRLYFK